MTALQKLAPGVLFATGLAIAAVWLAGLPWVMQTLHWSPLLIVILLGMAIASTTQLPEMLGPGIKWCQKPMLRIGVACLGIKLSLGALAEIGGPALIVVGITTAVGMAGGVWLAQRMGVERSLGLLLATGGAVCGASAIVAADSVVQAEHKDTAASLGIVTLWGTIGIVLYSLLSHVFSVGSFAYGLFCGATLHEVAQVVAASAAMGSDAQGTATVAKLARVALLAPIIFGLGLWLRRQGHSTGETKTPLLPWFVTAFLLLAALRTAAPSLGIESLLKTQVEPFVPFVLSIGMAGVGLQTGFGDLVKAGWRPVYLALIQWVLMIAVSVPLIMMLGHR